MKVKSYIDRAELLKKSQTGGEKGWLLILRGKDACESRGWRWQRRRRHPEEPAGRGHCYGEAEHEVGGCSRFGGGEGGADGSGDPAHHPSGVLCGKETALEGHSDVRSPWYWCVLVVVLT